jgi:ATP-binding cassette subfamily B protein
LARLYGLFLPLMMFLASGLNLAVLYFGGLDVMGGSIPFGTLVAFFAYVSMLFWPVFALGWVISLYQRGTASLDRINRLLFTKPEVSNQGKRLHTGSMEGRIEFRNLRFKYNGHYVLDNITLTIERGQTVGIVGRTGSGKTTLVSLLPRLYPVERGQLFIDGIDVNDWDLTALRRQIGFAAQEPFLFSGTIAENISFGSDDVNMEQIKAAAEIAALNKDIENFPDGFHTVIGERGITLSGGQKQRTAIARAMLIDPAILILDDATSSVDTETEDEINRRIKESRYRSAGSMISPGKLQKILTPRTTIIISHRVSSVKGADVILYLEDGRIVEQGSHEELLKRDGRYAELYRSQLLAMELEKLT